MMREQWAEIQAKRRYLAEMIRFHGEHKLVAADPTKKKYGQPTLVPLPEPPGIGYPFTAIRSQLQEIRRSLQDLRKRTREVTPVSLAKKYNVKSGAPARIKRYRSSVDLGVTFAKSLSEIRIWVIGYNKLKAVLSVGWGKNTDPLYKIPGFGEDFFPLWTKQLHTDAEGVTFHRARLARIKGRSGSDLSVVTSEVYLAVTPGGTAFGEGETMVQAKTRMGKVLVRKIRKLLAE